MHGSPSKLFFVVVVGGIAVGCGRTSTPEAAPPDVEAGADDGGKDGGRADDGGFILVSDASLPVDAGARDGADEDVRVPSITPK